MREYKCPKCEEDVLINEDNSTFVECLSCKSKLRINVDAEFINGRWIDLTTLSISKQETLPVQIYFPTSWNVFDKLKWSMLRYTSKAFPIVPVYY